MCIIRWYPSCNLTGMKFLLAICCSVCLLATAISAQTTPDFSGTWTMDPTRSEAAAQGTPIGPVVVAIRQQPGELHIATTRDGSTQTVRYLPAEAKAVVSGASVGSFRWNGPKLVTSLATDINKQAVTVEEVRTLNPAGTEMTVEVTLVVQHGYQSGGSSAVQYRNSPNTSTGTNVFVKAR
jgi:hypothetical protein